MKPSTRAGLIVVLALALLAGLVALVWRPKAPDGAAVPSASEGPSFEVTVEKPRLARPLFGILPTEIEEKLEKGGRRRFDSTSPGAEVGSVGPDRLELRADGWDLLIETDGEGRIGAGTRLVYRTELGERQVTLRCRPPGESPGYLRTTAREGTDELDGSFSVKLATCENVDSGKVTNWPPAPLTVSGSFTGLQRSHP